RVATSLNAHEASRIAGGKSSSLSSSAQVRLHHPLVVHDFIVSPPSPAPAPRVLQGPGVLRSAARDLTDRTETPTENRRIGPGLTDHPFDQPSPAGLEEASLADRRTNGPSVCFC